MVEKGVYGAPVEEVSGDVNLKYGSSRTSKQVIKARRLDIPQTHTVNQNK